MLFIFLSVSLSIKTILLETIVLNNRMAYGSHQNRSTLSVIFPPLPVFFEYSTNSEKKEVVHYYQTSDEILSPTKCVPLYYSMLMF